ncbi:MAG TPA: PAS domain S-box protein, partial [Edaphobacter sp.]|nr:PAS domain S-box protein [Edaphobacter sp.]
MPIPDLGEKYFRLAVESAPNAMVMVNHQGKIIMVNAQTEKLFGYLRRELLGQHVEILVPQASEGHPGFREDFFAHTQTRPVGAGRDLLARRKDGSQFPVEIGLNPIETDEGTWVLSSIVDITERKDAEAMLRESEVRFRNMADSAPVMMWVSGPDMLCTFFNKGWLTFAGITMDQALGNGWSARVHPDDRDRCYTDCASAFDARRTFQTEYRLRHADEEYRWVLSTGAPHFESNGVFAGYIGSCVDITEVKRTQEDALGRQKLESLGQIANGIAHDVNNLLAGILASVELVMAERAEGSSPDEGLLRVRTAAVRGGEIVRQLMIYGRTESLAFEPVDVSSLVDEMLQLLRVSISKHVTLKTEHGENLPAAHGNPAQIRQVVMNLVTNASEAIGDRNGVIHVTTAQVKIGSDARVTGAANLPAGDYLKLEVSDSGSGMTPEVQTRIFDPHFTTRFTGRGLGLATVQGIVRGHDGAIDVVSSLGKGTRIEVLLPCTNQPAEDFRAIEAPPATVERERVIGTVLVVEDEETLRLAVSKILRMKGFSVIEAIDGSAAVDLFRANEREIAVVLLDMTLPGMDGLEVF